jgi:ABC-type uncharacterized transport system substrate-binding protein
VRRREFFVFAVSAMALQPRKGVAQQSGTLHRVGYLSSGSYIPRLVDTFRQGLTDLGWIEGRNISFEYRYAQGEDERLPKLAEELVRLNVDVIVASPTPAALAAKNATSTIPIVGIGFDNPIERGVVASLAQPGGNVTGVSYSVGPEIFGKDLQLLRELVPEVQHIGVLSNSANPNHSLMITHVETAARSLAVEISILDARGPDEIEVDFAAMAREHVGAVFVFGDPMFGVHRARIAALAEEAKLPSMYTNRLHVEAGGLACYGPSFTNLWRRAATYVDKILKGAHPADLPVEQPTKFELVINLKTARALGLSVPPSLLARADEVIE